MSERAFVEGEGGRHPAGPLAALCRGLALLGGLLLLLLALLTVVSVLGRYLFGAPIRGDIEIVSLLTAVAVSLFLPYCQLEKGNVIVDVFTERAPRAVRAGLDALGSLLLGAVAVVFAWRLSAGAVDLRAYGDESMVLRLPTWWGFLVTIPCFALLAVVSAVTFWRDLRGGDDPP